MVFVFSIKRFDPEFLSPEVPGGNADDLAEFRIDPRPGIKRLRGIIFRPFDIFSLLVPELFE